MAAPLKPWERPGINYQNDSSLPFDSMSSPAGQEDRIQSAVGPSASISSVNSTPPQLPPRPSQQSNLSPLASRYGSGFGYGGLSGYSSPYGFGGYGSGLYGSPYSTYNNFGSHQLNSSFARQAEENSRPAFESIESIVNAVTSVGMMLDSTFQAVYNSFRAVIGVADNFSRLKSQLFQVFSALAFIRTLKYVYRRILELLRLRPKGEAEREWRQAFSEAAMTAAGSGNENGPKKSSWPILMFFGIIMGGPYLIWKLISAFSSTDEKGWAKGKEDHFVAKANYSFQGQGSDELSFTAGQSLIVAPKELQPRVRGWLLASTDGEKSGMIPANYVTVLGKRKGSQTTNNQPSPLRQTDSGISISQFSNEHQTTSPVPSQPIPTLPEHELDKQFQSLAAELEVPKSTTPNSNANENAETILSNVCVDLDPKNEEL